MVIHKQTPHLSHRRRAVLDLQQHGHNLALLGLLGRQLALVHVDQQPVKVLHVLGFQRRQILVLGLRVEHERSVSQTTPFGCGLHAEATGEHAAQRSGRGHQPTRGRFDGHVASGWW